MAAFNFKLQKLLDIRTEREEESKRIFKEAQNEKNMIENKLNAMVNDYNKYNVIDKRETIIEQKIKKNYLNALNISINETSKVLDEKNIILEKKREDLKQKQIERKTVEILKTKKKDEFIKFQNHLEQTANDEFALYGYIRKLGRR